ncbi:MAG: hypothetical protein ABI778_12140, partial [Ignavibacteriota bacterium]
MKNKIIAASILLSCFVLSASAQQKEVEFADPDWGEQQKIEERAAYWHAIEVSGPDTSIAIAKIRGYNEFVNMPRPKGMMIQSSTAWEQVGGSQDHTVSGRPTAIDFDPKNNQILYLGTSGGGLWKTIDGGNNWVSLSDSWSSFAMGGVAVDPSDGKIIYACTGDLYDQSGDGLYKSTDGGLNWDHIATDGATGARCNQVLIDPTVTSTIYITGTDGVRRSLDAGKTWKRILIMGGTAHMVINPTNTQILYAGGAGVIKKSTDGGSTWSTSDLASSIKSKNTITLAISKSNVSKIYASIGNTGSGTVGLALSTDEGETWTIANTTGYMGSQSQYDNACAVSPLNANTVVVGGLDIYGSSNSGTQLNQRTDWRINSSSSNFSHADVHVLTYSPTGQLYALTDGGIFNSGNNGVSWTQSKNSTLATMLFVGGDAAPDFSFILGGAQDNGINRATNGSKFFTQTLGGDGGHCFISQSDGQTAYSTYINASLQKSGDGGKSWNYGPNPNSPNNIIPLNSKLLSDGVPFYMNYDVSESDGAVLAIAGGSNVFYSNDGAVSI